MANKISPNQISFNFDETTPPVKEETTESSGMNWIQKASNAPYFITEKGTGWTPIGQNDAITWPELAGVFRRKDLASVNAYFAKLQEHGVNCIRLMLEYCQGENRYFERPVGTFQPNMIRMWDDLFALCERYQIRILLTPYDTFWMWRRWQYHPYHTRNGGVCAKRSQWLLCPNTREAIKQRLSFATNRWGKSGALFAWDLWNEIRPAHAGNSAKRFAEFVHDISSFLRQEEMKLFGKTHLQTVSVFTPVLAKDHLVAETIFRHPDLDFATVHFYEKDTIDRPRNTVQPALAVGRLTRDMIEQIRDNRPFFDSEHGPIFTFNTQRLTLPEPFDDECFRHMQWAHLASGGAGGGMRWPYRHPHILTQGMRQAQLALSNFTTLINWTAFNRQNLSHEIRVSDPGLAVFACGDGFQAIIWLLRKNATGKDRLLQLDVEASSFDLTIPLMHTGIYKVTLWNTKLGFAEQTIELNPHAGGALTIPLAGVSTDRAIVLQKL